MLREKQQFLKNELIKSKDCDIPYELLNTIVLDMSRIADKKITNIINEYKKSENIIITSPEKELLRKSILGFDVDVKNYDNFENFIDLFDKEYYLLDAYNLIIEGFNKNKNNVISSLYSRTKINKDIENKYTHLINKKEENFTQLLYYNLHNDSDIGKVYTSISSLYDCLENYHYCLLEFQSSCTWESIYKIAIFLENFKLEKKLNAFKKNKQKEVMETFIKDNFGTDSLENVIDNINSFYAGVNYGFQFQDLIITQNGERKLLVLQKIELDERDIPCPSCFETILRGNSYPKMLYKSFECQNPNCPSRSKSGRGKRFDYYSVKRSMKLFTNDSSNFINDSLRHKFRKDIVSNDSNFIEFGIKFYTWADNAITVIGKHKSSSILFDRNVRYLSIENYKNSSEKFYDLSIYKLLVSVYTYTHKQNEKAICKTLNLENTTLINGNSALLLSDDSYKDLYNLAITSPPYFNAREYSQWSNLILYLFDMQLNAKSVFNSIQNGGIYAYNIGDIVDRDNIYVNSQMSNKRQMLGFYSMMIFEIVGFKIIGNDIWDKGEVQSKRNSSSNSFPGFLKPINCYEHIIYFQKPNTSSLKLVSQVCRIDTVKKINSKGVNLYGHTAPYPEKLVEFIISKLSKYVSSNINILDPFVGSGTTCIVASRFNYKSTGIELNIEYFNLCKNRLREDNNNLIFNI